MLKCFIRRILDISNLKRAIFVVIGAAWLTSVTPFYAAPTQSKAPLVVIYPRPAAEYAQPAYGIPPLTEFLRDSDASTAKAIKTYFETHETYLRTLWQDDSSERLLGWLVMYLVHTSAPYGLSVFPDSVNDFVALNAAHCGTYSTAQSLLYHHLGLAYRFLEFDSGAHGWVELNINGQWEVFDSTTNIWLDRPMSELVVGMPRNFRRFYSPLTDVARFDYRAHLALGYDAPGLRALMPCIGRCYYPRGVIIEHVAVSNI